MTKKFFITGTDTGVGKTLVSCTLLHNLSKLGFLVSGYKPVSTGCEFIKNKIKNNDVCLLIKNSNVNFHYKQINPFAFFTSTSPNIASKKEKREIDINILSKKLNFFTKKVDFLIIEGIGGWFVPINKTFTMGDWVELEKIPIIMVVGMKLGCLNHALLTAYSIKQKNLKLLGWIANQLYPLKKFQIKDYIQTLKERIHAPMIGKIPYLKSLKGNDLTKSTIDLSYLIKY